MSLAVVERNPGWRSEELQLSSGLQLIVLRGGRRLRGAHFLPGGEGIAAMRVNPEMFDERKRKRRTCRGCKSAGFGHSGNRQVDRRSRSIHVLIVIIPDQHFDFVILARGDGADVRLLPHSGAYDLLDWKRAHARNFYAFAAEQPEHPEGIEHRFV